MRRGSMRMSILATPRQGSGRTGSPGERVVPYGAEAASQSWIRAAMESGSSVAVPERYAEVAIAAAVVGLKLSSWMARPGAVV